MPDGSRGRNPRPPSWHDRSVRARRRGDAAPPMAIRMPSRPFLQFGADLAEVRSMTRKVLRWLLVAALVTPVAAIATPPVPSDGPGTLRGGKVAVYDAETVLLAARSFAPERASLDRLLILREEEVTGLRDEVHRLRDRLNAEEERLSATARRRLEATLAERTIGLLATRTAAAREIAAARDALLRRLGPAIVPAVTAAALERGIAVVVRQDDATRVVGSEVLDLTGAIVARLDAGLETEPDLGRRARSRLQACAPPREEP